VRDVQRPFTVVDLAVEITGEQVTVTLAELFSIERGLLKASVGSLAAEEDRIRRSLDRLFTGF
jgi:toxin CcdB